MSMNVLDRLKFGEQALVPAFGRLRLGNAVYGDDQC
jgi:hypothetical protein